MSTRGGFLNIIIGLAIAVVAIWVGIVLIPLTVKRDMFAILSNPATTSTSPMLALPSFGSAPLSGASAAETGTLAGTVSLLCDQCNGTSRIAGRELLIYTADRTALAGRAAIGSDGTFALVLPIGSYYIDLPLPAGESTDVLPGYVVIKAQATSELTVGIRVP